MLRTRQSQPNQIDLYLHHAIGIGDIRDTKPAAWLHKQRLWNYRSAVCAAAKWRLTQLGHQILQIRLGQIFHAQPFAHTVQLGQVKPAVAVHINLQCSNFVISTVGKVTGA